MGFLVTIYGCLGGGIACARCFMLLFAVERFEGEEDWGFEEDTSGEPIRKVDAICLRDILVVIDGPGIGRRLCAEQCQMGRSLRL